MVIGRGLRLALRFPGLRISTPFGALFTVIALALINTKLWDAALFFTIPDTLSTQALTIVLANGVLFWIVVKILPGIEVTGVLPALAAPIIFSLCSVSISRYEKEIDWGKVASTGIQFIQQVRSELQPTSVAAPAAPPPHSTP